MNIYITRKELHLKIIVVRGDLAAMTCLIKYLRLMTKSKNFNFLDPQKSGLKKKVNRLRKGIH